MDARQRRNDVVVERFSYDDNDWAWSTIRVISELDVPSPGVEKEIEQAFRMLLRNLPNETFFALPDTLVGTKQGPDRKFFAEATKAADRWLRSARLMFGGSTQLRRAMKTTSPIIRQLSFTGVMVVDGRHFFPGQWSAEEVATSLRSSTTPSMGNSQLE